MDAMRIGLIGAVGTLVSILLMSAVLKTSGRPNVIAAYARVGVKPESLPKLAAVLALAAGGLVAGIVLAPVLGLITSSCLILYFILALRAHVVHRDLAHAGMPALILALAISAAVLFTLALRA